jgi:putative copper export protein
LALLHFGSLRQAMTTTYGDSLMLKVPLVAAALYLARLGRHRGELATLIAVLAAAAVLVSLPPPR